MGQNKISSIFSTEFIEQNSLIMRAWMVYIIVTGSVEKGNWIASFRFFEKQEQVSKWFNHAKRMPRKRRRNNAINTLLPHKLMSGDAITFCLEAVHYKPPTQRQSSLGKRSITRS